MRAFRRRFFWPVLMPAFWPLLALLIGSATKKKPFVHPREVRLSSVHVLTGNVSGFASGAVMGPDFTGELVRWLREDLRIPDVVLFDNFFDSENLGRPDIIVATYDFLLEQMNKGLRGFWETKRFLVSRSTPIWLFPPDTFWLELSAFCSALVSVSGGAIVLSQNSSADGQRFGLPHVIGHQFYTWPSSTRGKLSQGVEWRSRAQLAYVSSYGSAKRNGPMEKATSALEAQGFGIRSSGIDKPMDWDSYLSYLGECKIVVSETLTQDPFLGGPRYYEKKISRNFLTHRILEGFALGCVVITRDSDLLNNLGFLPGRHFLALPNRQEEWEVWFLPGETELETIAASGRRQFLRIATDGSPTRTS